MPKNIKIAILVGVAVLGLGVLLFVNQPSEHEEMEAFENQNNVLAVNEQLHDFGTISMKNGNVRTSFKVKNTTPQTVIVTKLYTTCMCTKATFKLAGRINGPFGMLGHGSAASFQEILEPNQEADVEVEYDPNAHGPSGVGTIERSVILEGIDGKLLTVNIKATVTP